MCTDRRDPAADATTYDRVEELVVHVPVNMVISIHHDTCVRIDRARATVDQQGWEVG